VAFVFVRSVNLLLHSPKLEKIGSVLVDCPGLFASRFDTSIADRAMSEADAILYLFPGYKGVAESEIKVLTKIRERGMEHKLFFGWNTRTTKRDAERLMTDAKAKLGNLGFRIPECNFFAIQAALALRVEQAQRLIQGTLDPLTRAAIAWREDCSEPEVPRVIWADIETYQRRLYPKERFPVEPDQESAEAARTRSGLPEIVAKCQDYVVRNKARFILLENGADVVVRRLQVVEGGLQEREAQAARNVQEHERIVAQADVELKNFEGRCETHLLQLENSDADFFLGKEFVERFNEAFLADLGDELTGRIFTDVIGWDLLWKGVFKRKEVENRVKLISEEVPRQKFDGQFRAWIEELESGSSTAYNCKIRPLVNGVSHALDQEWNKVAGLNLEILQKIPLPQISSNIREAVKQVPPPDIDMLDPAMAPLKKGGILAGTAIGAVIAAAIAFHIAASTTWLTLIIYGPGPAGPIGWVFSVIAAAAVTAFWYCGGKGAARKILAKKIKSELSNQWPRIQDELGKKAKELGSLIRGWYRETMRKHVVAGPRGEFERRKADADTQFQKSQEERDYRAAKAKLLRENHIAPLRGDLENFAADCHVALRSDEEQGTP